MVRLNPVSSRPDGAVSARENAEASGHEVGSMKSGYASGNFLIDTAENKMSAIAIMQKGRS
jgi:hypothetical protein